MNKSYVIYCSHEQTIKSVALGATWMTNDVALGCHTANPERFIVRDETPRVIVIPTAEEMLGWLRTKNIHIVINKDAIDNWSAYGHEIEPIEFTVFNRLTGYNSFEEATLAAIDATLNYLIEAKEK